MHLISACENQILKTRRSFYMTLTTKCFHIFLIKYFLVLSWLLESKNDIFMKSHKGHFLREEPTPAFLCLIFLLQRKSTSLLLITFGFLSWVSFMFVLLYIKNSSTRWTVNIHWTNFHFINIPQTKICLKFIICQEFFQLSLYVLFLNVSCSSFNTFLFFLVGNWSYFHMICNFQKSFNTLILFVNEIETIWSIFLRKEIVLILLCFVSFIVFLRKILVSN